MHIRCLTIYGTHYYSHAHAIACSNYETSVERIHIAFNNARHTVPLRWVTGLALRFVRCPTEVELLVLDSASLPH